MTNTQFKVKNWFLRHKILTGFLIFSIIGIIGSMNNKNKNPTNESTKISAEQCKSIDDLTTFTCRYGKPDEDENSADEKPQPLIITRMLTYKSEKVRAIYVPTSNSQPFEKWTLVGFQDPITLASIQPQEVVSRMKARDKKAN